MNPSASSACKLIKQALALMSLLLIVCSISQTTEAKLLRTRSRIYEDSLIGGGYGGGYGGGGPYAMGGATGERAILTVRGARNPYDGSAPSKIAIEDNPYRGPYPRGVYDRLDGGYGRPSRYPMYPPQGGDYGYFNGGGGYNSG